MATWNSPPVTQAELAATNAAVAAAASAASAAQGDATHALASAATAQAAADASGVAAAAAQATADAAVPRDTRPSTSGNVTILTGRPWGSNSGTVTFAKDTWRCTLTHMATPVTVAGLGVITTVAAALGTAVLIFGVWSRDNDGRPATRLFDWATLGSIDLTAAPGTLVLATPGLVIPAGEFFVGCAWAGTAVTSPVLVTHSGLAAGTDSLTGNNTGYSYAASGLAVPDPFVPATGTTGGITVLMRLV